MSKFQHLLKIHLLARAFADVFCYYYIILHDIRGHEFAHWGAACIKTVSFHKAGLFRIQKRFYHLANEDSSWEVMQPPEGIFNINSVCREMI